MKRRELIAIAGASLFGACDRRPTERVAASAPPPASVEASTVPSIAAPPSAPPSAWPLFERFPKLEGKLPRIALGRFPSRVEEAPALARDIGAEALFVKRDDDVADAIGGGKVRKLETYLGEALALHKKEIVTFGGVGSNQALAAAILGRSLGLHVRVYLAPQPRSSLVTKNLGADAATGAEMILASSVSDAERLVHEEMARGGHDTYVIPPGGTTPLGTMGFVSAGLELANAVAARAIEKPARIYVALGSGGSAAGIAIGCAIGGLDAPIVAVRASNPSTVTEAKLRAIVAETIAFARGRDASFPDVARAVAVSIDGRFVGAGYGSPTSAADSSILRAREGAGWELDPVYTGKAFAALVADSNAGVRGPLLFWNTQSSRPLAEIAIPPAFASFVERPHAPRPKGRML